MKVALLFQNIAWPSLPSSRDFHWGLLKNFLSLEVAYTLIFFKVWLPSWLLWGLEGRYAHVGEQQKEHPAVLSGFYLVLMGPSSFFLLQNALLGPNFPVIFLDASFPRAVVMSVLSPLNAQLLEVPGMQCVLNNWWLKSGKKERRQVGRLSTTGALLLWFGHCTFLTIITWWTWFHRPLNCLSWCHWLLLQWPS